MMNLYTVTITAWGNLTNQAALEYDLSKWFGGVGISVSRVNVSDIETDLVFPKSTQPDAFRAWCYVLQTTSVQQGSHGLRPSDDTRCCLGVACDVAMLLKPDLNVQWSLHRTTWYITNKASVVPKEEHSLYLSDEVQSYLGIRDADPILFAFTSPLIGRDGSSITKLHTDTNSHVLPASVCNDDGVPFPLMADLLKQAYL